MNIPHLIISKSYGEGAGDGQRGGGLADGRWGVYDLPILADSPLPLVDSPLPVDAKVGLRGYGKRPYVPFLKSSLNMCALKAKNVEIFSS